LVVSRIGDQITVRLILLQSQYYGSDIAVHNIKKIDLNLLVVLDALLDERNVTRAAARLGYTQPTISGMLTRLRDLFGDPLFVRTQRGLLATPRAQALAAPLKQLLADSRRLVARDVFDPASAKATFSISSNDYMQQAVLVPLIKVLRDEARNVRIAITPPIIEGLAEALARGQIDLAITIPEFAMSDLRSRLLYREHYVVAVRPQHPLARRAAMTVERFCNYDHVVVSPTGGSFEGPTDQALARLQLRRKVRYSVPSFLLLPEMLQTDDLVALVPFRLLSENNKRLVVLNPPVDVPGFDVIAVWHPRVDKDIAHRWLRSRLVNIAKIPWAKAAPTAVIQPLHRVDDGVHFADFACRKAAQSNMLVHGGLAIGGCGRSGGLRHCASTTPEPGERKGRLAGRSLKLDHVDAGQGDLVDDRIRQRVSRNLFLKGVVARHSVDRHDHVKAAQGGQDRRE
jgi:DNA-binding transcriptional LysR family regulator